MKYFDAHCHLQDGRLGAHLERVLDEMEGMGVGGVVVNGTIERDWEAVGKLAAAREWIIPSYGLHPWLVGERSKDWERRLNERLDEGGVMGEIGLDRWKEGLDFEDQREVFRAQLRMAAKRNVAATIHCLRAWGVLWDIIREEAVPECGFLLHAYGGPVEMVEGFAKRGAYFSFNGYYLAQEKRKKMETFLEVPLDRLLVETDAPFMHLPMEMERYSLPDTAEGERVNHPGNLVVAYEGLAKLRGIEVGIIMKNIQENFAKLFMGAIFR